MNGLSFQHFGQALWPSSGLFNCKLRCKSLLPLFALKKARAPDRNVGKTNLFIYTLELENLTPSVNIIWAITNHRLSVQGIRKWTVFQLCQLSQSRPLHLCSCPCLSVWCHCYESLVPTYIPQIYGNKNTCSDLRNFHSRGCVGRTDT